MRNSLAFLDSHMEEILGSILLAAMAVISFLNVVVRYCTSFSFAWSEEMTVNFFVWVTMLGTACAFREGCHLAMNIVYEALPKRGRLCAFIFDVLICLIFFGALFWTGCLEVTDEIELKSVTESMEIPVWWYTMATPLFSLLIIYRMLQRCRAVLRSAKY